MKLLLFVIIFSIVSMAQTTDFTKNKPHIANIIKRLQINGDIEDFDVNRLEIDDTNNLRDSIQTITGFAGASCIRRALIRLERDGLKQFLTTSLNTFMLVRPYCRYIFL